MELNMKVILSFSELLRLAKAEADARKYGTQEDIVAAAKAHESYKDFLRKENTVMNLGLRLGDL